MADYLILALDVSDLDLQTARPNSARPLSTVSPSGIEWVTLLDPEGNEFCVVPS